MIVIPSDRDEWIKAQVHRLTLDRRELSEILADIDALEVRVRAELGLDAYAADVLNVRRVLARVRLTKALELGGNAILAKQLFEIATSLGFANPGERVVASALFSRICLANDNGELLGDELEEALAGLSAPIPAGYLQLLHEIRHAKRR
jgi:hypothetical protein